VALAAVAPLAAVAGMSLRNSRRRRKTELAPSTTYLRQVSLMLRLGQRCSTGACRKPISQESWERPHK
jgi:hypothetical protein